MRTNPLFISTRISKEDRDRFTLAAKRRKISRSEALRQAIERFIETSSAA